MKTFSNDTEMWRLVLYGAAHCGKTQLISHLHYTFNGSLEKFETPDEEWPPPNIGIRINFQVKSQKCEAVTFPGSSHDEVWRPYMRELDAMILVIDPHKVAEYGNEKAMYIIQQNACVPKLG